MVLNPAVSVQTNEKGADVAAPDNCVFLIGGFWGFLGLTQIPVTL